MDGTALIAAGLPLKLSFSALQSFQGGPQHPSQEHVWMLSQGLWHECLGQPRQDHDAVWGFLAGMRWSPLPKIGRRCRRHQELNKPDNINCTGRPVIVLSAVL